MFGFIVVSPRDSEADVDRIASQLKVEMMGDPRLDAETIKSS
jgi:hypothetical protein